MPKQRRDPVGKQLRKIKKSIVEIQRSVARVSALMRESERRFRRADAGRRKLALSPKRRATLKLQGAYMGYMRQLKPGQKASVRALKQKKGFDAAIRLGKRLAGK